MTTCPCLQGTQRIGTTNYAQEAGLLDAMDEVFYELREAQQNSGSSPVGSSGGGGSAGGGGSGRVARLADRLKQLQEEADALVVPNAFGSLLEQQGAVGLNAATSQDGTRYFCSLPANKLELWFALEAERFQVRECA